MRKDAVRQNGHRHAWTWLRSLVVAWVVCGTVVAQTAPRLESRLPTVPEQPSRPIDTSQGWGMAASEKDPSVSAFVEPIKGNDAAIFLTIGQGRTLTTKEPISRSEQGIASIAVGDPTVLEFDVMPNPKMIRLLGNAPGTTDISFTTASGEAYSFEVHVGYDLELLSAQLRQLFPDADLRVGQISEHLVVEGQARSARQVELILQTLEAYLASVLRSSSLTAKNDPTNNLPMLKPRDVPDNTDGDDSANSPGLALDLGMRPDSKLTLAKPRIINLLRVPGVQQVMLQVRIAELNRTAMRQIGSDILKVDPSTGNILGTQIGGNVLSVSGSGSSGTASAALGAQSTFFGVFPTGDWQILFKALRSNAVLNVLAEPNLVALSGQRAAFLAGGQFPVPVPQGGGNNNAITIEYKDFGVRLDFVPYIQDDGVIRLHVAPEVSSIDFSIGTTLVVGGTPVPGLNTRKAETTVEMRQGQTLAMAGLLKVDLDANTNRIPGLGDMPYLGPLFSNTTHTRVEKELIVLVTPLLVAPMNTCDVGPLPGSEITDPNDKEFFCLNRIEGRTGRQFRSTTSWDNPLGLVEKLELQNKCTCGHIGFSR